MADWDSELYIKFKQQRTQPAIDLVNRLNDCHPYKIADIGCGPGNSTAVLHRFFPDSEIIGIDSSPDMIEKAQSEHPELSFRLCDARELHNGYDLLFSNACLQWIADHKSLLPDLMSKLNPGGTLAVQIPCNSEEPLYKIIRDVAEDSKWGFQNIALETNSVLKSDEYFDILSGCSSSFDIWETVYYHAMPSHQSLVDWVKGTRLRPYLHALTEEQAAMFEEEILRRTINAYPVMKNGTVILRFKRLFFTARSR